MMREMDLDNTSPGPEASEHLKVFMCVKYGIDICCDALKVIKQKDKKEQMQLFTDINDKWRLYKGTHDTLSVGQKRGRGVAACARHRNAQGRRLIRHACNEGDGRHGA